MDGDLNRNPFSSDQILGIKTMNDKVIDLCNLFVPFPERKIHHNICLPILLATVVDIVDSGRKTQRMLVTVACKVSIDNYHHRDNQASLYSLKPA